MVDGRNDAGSCNLRRQCFNLFDRDSEIDQCLRQQNSVTDEPDGSSCTSLYIRQGIFDARWQGSPFFFFYQDSYFQDKPSPQIINTIIEPAILAVGPVHLAVGLNNRALFWDLSSSHYDKIHFERDYLASIDSMRLNETYISVLFDGKLQLHSVITSNFGNFELMVRIPHKMGLIIFISCVD